MTDRTNDRFIERIPAYLNGELSDDERRELETPLASSEELAAYLDAVRSSMEMLESDKSTAASSDFKDRIFAAIDNMDPAEGMEEVIEKLKADRDSRTGANFKEKVFAELERRESNVGRANVIHTVFKFAAAAAAAVIIIFTVNSDKGLTPKPGIGTNNYATVQKGEAEFSPRTLACLWLKERQDDDGSWNVQKFGGKKGNETAVTGLALIAFLKEGKGFEAEARKAAQYLINQQDKSGRIGKPGVTAMYNHGIATTAMAEAKKSLRIEGLDKALDKAVAFISASQTGTGGWGYRGANSEKANTAVTAWQIQALNQAKLSGTEGCAEPLDKGLAYIRSSVREDNTIAYTGETAGVKRESMSAMGAFCLLTSDDSGLRSKGSNILAALARAPEKSMSKASMADPYMAYFLSQAKNESASASSALVNVPALSMSRMQVAVGPEKGSLPHETTAWGSVGGRAYTTAMMAASLPDHL
ncbi:MAG: hypothetical protein JXR97_04815 [Planctomycetes bacterium]|nr:hypothetical protein [Planctomycetota bacterium]